MVSETKLVNSVSVFSERSGMIGFVKALTLPMACILTQLLPGNKCHFLVRATDVNGRQGECSEACTITLK